jgi:hypothetical protein
VSKPGVLSVIGLSMFDVGGGNLSHFIRGDKRSGARKAAIRIRIKLGAKANVMRAN